MADIKNPLEFLIQRFFVVELVGLPGKWMPGWRLKTTFSPFAFTHDQSMKMPGSEPGIFVVT